VGVRSLNDSIETNFREWTSFSDRDLKTVKTSLSNGDDVLVSGFGKFSAKKKAPRKGRNPVTGEALPLDARTVVTFRCSGVLRDRLNGAG